MVKVILNSKSTRIEKIVTKDKVAETIEWLKGSGIEGSISIEPV